MSSAQPVQCSPFPVAPRLMIREKGIFRTFGCRCRAVACPCPRSHHVGRTIQGVRTRRRRGIDRVPAGVLDRTPAFGPTLFRFRRRDRKSTRLNSSHLVISYAVLCLKKKKKKKTTTTTPNQTNQQTHPKP